MPDVAFEASLARSSFVADHVGSSTVNTRHSDLFAFPLRFGGPVLSVRSIGAVGSIGSIDRGLRQPPLTASGEDSIFLSTTTYAIVTTTTATRNLTSIPYTTPYTSPSL
ncbi:hypothetical protein OGAPHI_000630 [Ogataea philodendri]|uniref:Uncharacterized protein n=1 Tax=Ogataea philodendri TaxID=1378263 RepID=A0A9P8PGL2_9ASCO|nr:uncharacterized protein OGAPHI_000630 [Ogataea philodendri]KAH3670919.1 hypothetical protein OGAPHI_000630 [Ogataea philodendri]